ncbi:MAG: hypothetical protein ACSHX9_05530 [Luteolibacter sp.]
MIPAAIMLISGFGVLVAYSFGGRFTAADSQLIPLGLTTVVVGAISLSRTLLSTFFLFVYAVTAVVLIIVEHGIAQPWLIPFVLLILLCLPQAKHARR